ncbi:hypothetical protein GY45DRAFT_696747 [Cubamyces sp. BRFM 1775]|nr:hypothetical protein GY45DRAFT_696747 [Cubamyces sp. BRFM 1775]
MVHPAVWMPTATEGHLSLACTAWLRLALALGLLLQFQLPTALVAARAVSAAGPHALAISPLDAFSGQDVLGAAGVSYASEDNSSFGRKKGKKKPGKGEDREYENGELPPVEDTVGWTDPRLNGGRLIDVSAPLLLPMPDFALARRERAAPDCELTGLANVRACSTSRTRSASRSTSSSLPNPTRSSSPSPGCTPTSSTFPPPPLSPLLSPPLSLSPSHPPSSLPAG